MNEKIELSTIELPSSTNSTKTIIWLHGLGADGNDFVPIVRELNLPKRLDVRFIFPNANVMPVTINQGYKMRAWYDIYGFGAQAKIDEAGINQSVKSIHQLIEKQESRGVSSKDILLGGFSQGSVIALIAGLTYHQPLRGIIALSGYFPLADKMLPQSVANRNIPIFMGHGDQDNVVSYMFGLASYNLLKEAGFNIEWHSYRMGHSVCAEEIHDISGWIGRVWS